VILITVPLIPNCLLLSALGHVAQSLDLWQAGNQ